MLHGYIHEWAVKQDVDDKYDVDGSPVFWYNAVKYEYLIFVLLLKTWRIMNKVVFFSPWLNLIDHMRFYTTKAI